MLNIYHYIYNLYNVLFLHNVHFLGGLKSFFGYCVCIIHGMLTLGLAVFFFQIID